MASKRRIRRNMCNGKVRHKTREFAEIALRNTKRENSQRFASSGLADFSSMNAYKCEKCGFFHVGHINLGVKNDRYY